MSIEEFAERYGLTMVVRERNVPEGSSLRFYAHFKYAEIKDGRILIGESGNGATPEDAIDDYAKQIELKHLVVDAFGKNRTEMDVPRLIRNVK